MAQKRSNIPTIAEKLTQSPTLTPAVRSYSYHEYDEKRPGYVNADRNAGGAMASLARSLSGFYNSFNRMATHRIDEQIEKDTALGIQLQENQYDDEGMLRNKRSWKEFVEKNPEYANMSPWVRRGFEESRLRQLGVEMESGLRQHIDEQGGLNFEDPAQFQSLINTYIVGFRKDNELDSYEDKLLMSKFFSPIEANVRQSLTTVYDQAQVNARQGKLALQTSQEIASHITTAVQEGRAVDLNALGHALTSACDNGLLNKNAVECALNGIKTAYAQEPEREVLDMLKVVEVNGIPLYDTKEGAEWYQREVDKISAAEVKAAKAKEKEDSKHLGVEGESYIHHYAANLEQFESEDAIIEHYKNQTGIELTGSQRTDFISDIRKVRTEITKNRKMFAELPMNAEKIAQMEFNIITSSSSKYEAASELYKQASITGVEAFRKTADKLMDQQNTNHFDQLKSLGDSATKQLKEFADNIVDTFIAQDVASQSGANIWNKNRLKEDVKASMEADYYSAYNNSLGRLQEEDTKRSTLSLQSQAQVEALQSVREKASQGYYTRRVNAKDYTSHASTDSKYGAVISKDMDDATASQLREWVDVTNSWLQSSDNSGICKVSVNELAEDVNIQRLALDGVILKEPKSLLPYVIFHKHEHVEPHAFSADGKTLFLDLLEDIPEERVEELEIRMRHLFPLIEHVAFIKPPSFLDNVSSFIGSLVEGNPE